LATKNTFFAAKNVPSDTRKRRNLAVRKLGTPNKGYIKLLKEAGVEVTNKNKEKIDEAIHKYIGKQSSYGRCSADWRKTRKEIQENEEMKQELIGKLRSLV